jgi:hypothetical protein
MANPVCRRRKLVRYSIAACQRSIRSDALIILVGNSAVKGIVEKMDRCKTLINKDIYGEFF